MSADNYETPYLKKDDLSDDDIELLYDIVRRAQTLPERSPHALFAAYEDILAENGLHPSDDTVLHPFLFRMLQDRTRDNESLFQRFQRTLGTLGITVEEEFDEEAFEMTTNAPALAQYDGRSRYHVTAQTLPRRRSLDSYLDGSADKVAGTEELPFGPDIGQGTSTTRLPGERRVVKRRSNSDTEAHSYLHAQIPIRTIVNGYPRRRSVSHQPRQRRSGSVSSRGSIRIHRTGRLGTHQLDVYDAEDSDHTEQTDDLDLSRIHIPGVNAPIPAVQNQPDTGVYDEDNPHFVPEPYRPSDTRLLDDAERMEASHYQTVLRNCIRKWQDRTAEQIRRNENLNDLASSFDRRILLKLSLDTWVGKYRESRSVQETERFFARLENRAQKARNLFLLTKAFTHWAKSAEDEVLRTSVARRHILRTKFFNGWREITAVNELKIQHFVLGNFLAKWRKRTAQMRRMDHFANLLYEDNLQQRTFKTVFFKYCEQTAHSIHDRRIKRNTYTKWHEIAIALKDREDWATARQDRRALRTTIQKWQQRMTATKSLEIQAEIFRRKTLLTSTFFAIQKQAQLSPLLKQCQLGSEKRLLHNILLSWQHRSNISRQARQVDRLRILRNALTAWNDRLRIKVVEDRINDRILIESLYKWTLASRVSLFQRVHDRSLKETAFLHWVTKTNANRNSLEVAERKFAQFKRAQTLRTCLRKIENATVQRKTEEAAVVAEVDRNLKQRIFGILMQKHEHLQQLNQWAGDARFYVLTTHALNSWKEATQHARRNRRREAYAQIRRKIKTSLVRRMFETWSRKTNVISQQEQQATQFAEAHTYNIAATLMTRWRERTLALRDISIQAEQRYNGDIAFKYLESWTRRMETLRTFEAQASALRQENTEIAAASALKKLGWRLWTVRRQEETAIALHQRNFEKHVRAMLRFWLERTVTQAAKRDASPTPIRRSTREARRLDDVLEHEEDPTQQLNFDDAGDDTRRLEAWTAFDENGLGLSNLDLSLSMSPPPQRQPNPAINPPIISPHKSRTLSRPQTYPQPQSALRPPPATIPEDLELEMDDPSAFWASTPAFPKKTPGYLKTPSKRSVARSKRPELPASPEKRTVGLDRGIGIRSAPPGQTHRDVEPIGGVTSFQARLREGGFDDLGRGEERGRERVRPVGRGRARVGFGDVSEFG
ncbi:Sfi1-domain-containing protein [Corynespora cassiicola Philippines]|uniref:Sfi1-domain-containing protein n=1 Tax=Corynespora cassiicola Philippines TaxID=1448308 RepID=A0A2T2NTA6_CORCC|nr:Sfi1-domain-containing protein [Corynespora cassiicola Philippines]